MRTAKCNVQRKTDVYKIQQKNGKQEKLCSVYMLVIMHGWLVGCFYSVAVP